MKVLFILIFLFLALISGKIKLIIKDFYFYSNKTKHINPKINIIFVFKIFNNIPVFSIKFDYNKIRKLRNNKFLNKKFKNRKIKFRKILRNLPFAPKNIIKEFDLDIKIGTKNANATALIIPIITTLISLILEYVKVDYTEDIKYKVNPIYNNQNLLNIYFSGIFEMKVIHIISTICKLKKRNGDKHERTSNRRTYDYSYE